MDANPLDDPGLSDFANYDYSDDPTRDFLDPEYQAAIAEAWRERWDGVDGGISDTSFDIFNIITSIAPIGKAAMAAGGLWSLTRAGSSEVLTHSTFGNFYKSASDGLWWSVDNAGHGGSAFKVFEETSTGLQWYRDADQFGNFISGKYKGRTGLFIPWSQLH